LCLAHALFNLPGSFRTSPAAFFPRLPCLVSPPHMRFLYSSLHLYTLPRTDVSILITCILLLHIYATAITIYNLFCLYSYMYMVWVHIYIYAFLCSPSAAPPTPVYTCLHATCRMILWTILYAALYCSWTVAPCQQRYLPLLRAVASDVGRALAISCRL